MIYPEFFPEDRKDEKAEEKVFNSLKKLSNKYDVFYSKKFVTDGVGKKPQFEVDFIIAVPNEVVICLEVKGGLIQYDGSSDQWWRNGKIELKRPEKQATEAANTLIKMYKGIIGDMVIGWGLCFTDVEVKDRNNMPEIVKPAQVVDQLTLIYLDEALEDLIQFLKKQYSHKNGVRHWQYNSFKNQLLRSIGFVQVLSTRIKEREKKIVELTDFQNQLFQRASANKKVICEGPAGSGKTILAKTIAQDFINDGKKVLFMCFNRTLANKIRYEFDRNEENINVTTFHSLARAIITEFEPDWWDENAEKDEEFWNLEVPVKLQDFISYKKEEYDVLIIDEGQDFKDFWYELVFQLVKPDGNQLIFLDPMQNVFGHYTQIPNESSFFKWPLTENCRNTKNIVSKLSDATGRKIECFKDSPEGEEVVERTFKNNIEQQTFLVSEIKSLIREQNIDPSQILIMLNSTKADSCIAEVQKIANLPLHSVDNKGRLLSDAINYTNINTFKGLEADIVFVVDIQLIPTENKLEKLYTESSRARHKLYLLTN